MEADDAGVKMEFPNPLSFGFDVPSDSDMSSMVNTYLSKDSINSDEWARVVDEAICIMTNQDFMSMPATMTPTTNGHDMNFNGMFNDQTAAQVPLSHQNFDGYYQNADQYGNHGMNFGDQMYMQQDQYPQNIMHQQHQQNNMHYQSEDFAYYNNGQPQQPQNDMGTQVYVVGQSSNKFNESHPDIVTYQNFATLPGIATQSVMNFNPISRTLSNSSGGNSPSSQSPISEDEFLHETRVQQRKQTKEPASKKGKAQKDGTRKIRRKKDPNEPTKPVSAYALFFRDTQATIKGTKPDASFGEVSKIVAAMWDSLDVERKTMYKKKTEEAKKEYLQQLALYRASLITSPPETSLYIQTFQSRSPQPPYVRPSPYGNPNHGHQMIKAQNVSPSTLSPQNHSMTVHDENHQAKNENQSYVSRATNEQEMMMNNANSFLPWETSDDDLFTSSKDPNMYTNWILTHQATNQPVDGVQI